MEVEHLLSNPDIIMSMLRRVSSDKRNEQLRNLMVNRDELSLSYRIHITMYLELKGESRLHTDSFQVPETNLTTNGPYIIERSLKLMDYMTRDVEN
jgi:hypothetical protein